MTYYVSNGKNAICSFCVLSLFCTAGYISNRTEGQTMNQMKIGKLLKELRTEKNLTQEQLAESLNVSRRTVSRWETGFNLPDLDILVIMSDFYQVDLRELLDGERRSEKMDEQMKETVMKVAQYSNEEKRRASKVVLVFFGLGIVALFANVIMRMMDITESFVSGFFDGATIGIAIGAMVLGILYVTGAMVKIQAFKRRLLRGER